MTEYLKKDVKQSQVKLFDLTSVKQNWVNLFDPTSSISLKNKLKKTFRDDVQSNTNECIKGIQPDCLSTYKTFSYLPPSYVKFSSLPSGLTVAMVMCQGYRYNDVYASLKKDFIAERSVLIGYSTGLNDPTKKFKDGTLMAGKIFITEEDLKVIRQTATAPMLFVDIFITTGLTLATIGNSLRKELGYSGEFYVMEGHSFPRKWNNAVDNTNVKLSAEAPILTERSKLLSEVKRKSS
ncbi:MAG: hypothetical protein ABSD68_01385 [Candidatus Micrarchaeales archaeon]